MKNAAKTLLTISKVLLIIAGIAAIVSGVTIIIFGVSGGGFFATLPDADANTKAAAGFLAAYGVVAGIGIALLSILCFVGASLRTKAINALNNAACKEECKGSAVGCLITGILCDDPLGIIGAILMFCLKDSDFAR